MKNDETARQLYLDIAKGLASHLFNNQVIVKNENLDFSHKNSLKFSFFFLRGSKTPVDIEIKHNNGKFVISGSNRQSIACNQFFRITERGGISTLEAFDGLKETHKSAKAPEISEEPNPNTFSTALYQSLKSIVRLFPFVFSALKKARDQLVPPTHSDLAHCEGISFRIIRGGEDNTYLLESYDLGGIYDHYLNAEGIKYPPQVAGNYYADGYSCLLFLELYQLEKDPKWLQAARESWAFLSRIYPQYQPASIVWHHSDFKNAAILEVLDRFSTLYPEFRWHKDLVEDHYEPTNVFALRFHWKSLAMKLGRQEASVNALDKDLQRLVDDQTLDGLFHDNIDTYPDAHDLTYHQYSTACLAQGLLVNENSTAKDIFLNAMQFSLNTLGPDVEPAYTGRASNNLHQSASAILAYHIASHMTADQHLINQFHRGALLIAKRLKRYQTPTGMIPTALNLEIDKRMGWNHCETPYNALAGYFLCRSLNFIFQGNETTSEPIPLENPGIWIANDAGFATLSNGTQYIVIFSGCDESYGWSENRHKTGCAGLALYGHIGKTSFTPCLDFEILANQLVSDLPTINGKSPFGRGELTINASRNGVILSHQYGNSRFQRTYCFDDKRLIMETLIETDTQSLIDGVISWYSSIGKEKLDLIIHSKDNKVVIEQEDYKIHLDIQGLSDFSNDDVIISKVTNPKGDILKIALNQMTDKTLKYVTTISYCPDPLISEH